MPGDEAEARHQRTRAILWCLLDVQPDMPLAEALGYLKAVEAELDRLEAEAELARGRGSRYRGSAGVADLVRDFASDADVAREARAGHLGVVQAILVDKTGCSDLVAGQAAKSLISTLHESRPLFPF